MTNLKSALQSSMQNKEETAPKEEVSKPIKAERQEEVKPKKRRRGRPSKVHSETKLHKILESRGMTRKDLYELIKAKYPDEPISPDAVSRIVSGKRKYYSTTTLFRICGALAVSPNMALNWEEEIV